MRSRRFPVTLATVLAFCMLALAGCTQDTSQPPAVARATYSYSCCTSSDISAVRHPGEVIHLHWIVTPGVPTTASTAVPVTLSVSLYGPFSTVEALKGASPGVPVATATTIDTTNWAGGSPVSTLVIPQGATGLYNLTTTVASQGGSLSGGSVVQVAPSGS